MQKGLLILVLIALTAVHAEVVSTKKGEDISSSQLNYSDGRFSTDGRIIDRDEVKSVFFVREDNQEKEEKVTLIDGRNETGQFVRKLPPFFKLDKPEKLMKEAQNAQKKYPDVQEIVLRDCGRNRLLPDGQRSYMYHRAVKILKDSAIQTSQQFWWGEDRTSIRFFVFRIIAPDGTEKFASSEGISVHTPPSDGAAHIDQGKTITVPLPDVTVGSIVEYIYESFTYNPYEKDFFFPSYGFEDNNPVLVSSYEIILPENKNLYWKAMRMEEHEKEPEQWKDKLGKHFKWTVLDSPPIVSEPKMPAYYNIAKVLKSSIIKEWDEFFAWERKNLDDKIEATPFLREETEKIVAGAKTKEEKLAKIYHWVQQQIRYISIKSGIGSGFAGHKAEMTFKNKFGDCIDKAILMSAMCKVCDIESYPLYIKCKPGAIRTLDFPNFGTNHAISVVYLDGRRIVLDSTATTYRYPYFRNDDQGRWVDNPYRNEHFYVEVPHPSTNCYHRRQVIRVNPDGSALISYRTRYFGSYEAGARSYWMYRRQDMWEQELRKMISYDFPDAKLVSYKINNVFDIAKPFSRELNWKTDKVFKKAGKFRILDLKLFKSFEETSLAERKYPILYTSSEMNKYEYIVILPENMRVKHLPEDVCLSNDYGEFIQESRLTENGFTYSITQSIKSDWVPAEDYEMYKAFNKQVEDCFQKIIFLEKLQ